MTTFRSPPTNLIEADLIHQAAQDDVQTHHAFAELYRRHVDRVYRYLMARTGNVQDAQDLTSQTFVAALEGISNYRGDASFAAWVLGIAQRKTADHYRQHYAQGFPIALEDVEQLAQAAPQRTILLATIYRLNVCCWLCGRLRQSVPKRLLCIPLAN